MDHELAPGPPHCSHLGSSDLGALGTCLPSLDLPESASLLLVSLCRKIPRLESAQGCRAGEGGASPYSGIPSPSESFHCKNVSYAKACTKGSFSLLLPLTLLRFPCQALWAASRQGQGVCAGGHSAHTQTCGEADKQMQHTDTHGAHTHRHTQIHVCATGAETRTRAQIQTWIWTQIHKQTPLRTEVDAHVDTYMHTSRRTRRPALPLLFLGVLRVLV